ncbi:hypothetical protein ACFK0I_32515, partial [Pseudomonas aeruginosa]
STPLPPTVLDLILALSTETLVKRSTAVKAWPLLWAWLPVLIASSNECGDKKGVSSGQAQKLHSA